ncbi:MAG TPA: hypothetical protein VIS52_05445 [Motiliproteus sp.]
MIPKTVYEMLPLIYLTAGVLAVAQLQHQAGTFGGVLLISCAALVAYLRYSYRRQYA